MKITFLGAGSSVFARNVLGDCMLSEALHGAVLALYDIDEKRLSESLQMLRNINANCNKGRAVLKCYAGLSSLPDALKGADFVINAVQVGGYKPCTVADFEIPKKYGLRQTIADTVGIGGIFRALRTIPVVEEFARQVERWCPSALFLNYTNPMAILTGYLLRYTDVRVVGICHSVQKCVPQLLQDLEIPYDETVQWKIAGVNHMGWLLEVSRGGKDLYPEIRRRSIEMGCPEQDRVRHEIMRHFGYYVTESSEHSAEYMPYFIKKNYPELIQKFNIPLDEYPRRCIRHEKEWEELRVELTQNPNLTHTRSIEYASYIIESVVTNRPYKFGGNILNNGIIPNLPSQACVEVPCFADAGGVVPTFVGELPEQCAALNRTNINVHMLTIEAARTRRREAVYHAAMLDPHTAAELSLDEIVSLCDDLFEAHKDWLPAYQ